MSRLVLVMCFLSLPAIVISQDAAPSNGAWKTLRFDGEFRTRYEARTGVSFGRAPDLEFPLIRSRIGVDWHPKPWVRLRALAQDARAPLYGSTAPGSQRDTLDLQEAYAEFFPDRERGFSFESDGPLDLRFDVSRGRPASHRIASASAAELAELFRTWGEEPHAERIAAAIVAARGSRDLTIARELADVVASAVSKPRTRGGSHPATRVFQALRIAVNDELGELRRMLDETLPACLKPGGRAVLISFHSLEDRW